MVLMIDSDAAYLVLPNAKSRIAGYFYFSNHPSKTTTPSLNGAIMVVCKALKNVVSSAAESEIAGVFINAQLAIPIQYILDRLNYSQPPTPIKTDNSTSYGFVHNNINQKRSKSWDMRYHWLREKQTKNEFNIIWDKGTNNHADYFTKHHPAKHHLHVRNTLKYVRDRSPPKKMILSAIASTFPCDLACEGVLWRTLCAHLQSKSCTNQFYSQLWICLTYLSYLSVTQTLNTVLYILLLTKQVYISVTQTFITI